MIITINALLQPTMLLSSLNQFNELGEDAYHWINCRKIIYGYTREEL